MSNTTETWSRVRSFAARHPAVSALALVIGLCVIGTIYERIYLSMIPQESVEQIMLRTDRAAEKYMESIRIAEHLCPKCGGATDPVELKCLSCHSSLITTCERCQKTHLHGETECIRCGFKTSEWGISPTYSQVREEWQRAHPKQPSEN